MTEQNKSKTKRTAIMVLGMHRSGTSAITRIINLHGAEISQNLETANEFNSKGYWESTEIMQIHDELLNSLGSTWMGFGKIPSKSISTKGIKTFKPPLVKLLERDFSSSTMFLVKDPRITRFYSLWLDVLSSFDSSPLAVIPFRHPAEVAKSLMLRDGTSEVKALSTWLRSTLDVVTETQNTPRSFVNYSSLLVNWKETVKKIETDLDTVFPITSNQVAEEVEQFLSPSLKHFDADDFDPEATVIHRLASATYAILQLLQEDSDHDIAEALSEVEKIFDPIAEAFSSSFDSLDVQLLALSQSSHENAELADSLKAERTLYKTELEAHKKNTTEVFEHATNLEKLRFNLEAELKKLRSNVKELRSNVKELRCSNEQADKLLQDQRQQWSEENASFSQQVSVFEKNAVDLQQQIVSVQSDLDYILQSNSYRLMGPLRRGRRVFVTRPAILLRSKASNVFRRAWKSIPFSVNAKQRAKSFFYNSFPFLFRSTRAYGDWYRFTGKSAVAPGATIAKYVQPHRRDKPKEIKAIIPSRIEKTSSAFCGTPAVKLIAFYLPQFHAIPENDEWWGEGFTEWTNVVKPTPAFKGHIQPHVPDELGYYNLLDSEAQQAQVALAKLYGVGGFCFYFYWFAGQRLLEQPTINYLENEDLDFPFCLCWANENWSRRWDGLDSEILMAQDHSLDDDIEFISYISKYLLDPRYIRVGGKPLLLVYRPSLLPEIKKTVERWRDWCRSNGIGEIYLAYTQSFESVDPRVYGFDAAVEFPPNNSSPPDLTENVTEDSPEFNGAVYDWEVFPERSDNYITPAYTLYRSVCPAWDNSARRGNNGVVFANSTPERYQYWLENGIADTSKRFNNPDDRFMFVNAWNEWAEGAHLEPDEANGFSYLQATRNALSQPRPAAFKMKLLLVTHDCHPHGAQFLALELARCYMKLGFELAILSLGGGRLREHFEHCGQFVSMEDTGFDIDRYVVSLQESNIDTAVLSTTVSGAILPQLKGAGIKTTTLIHEMPGVIRDMSLQEEVQTIASMSDALVFPAEIVRQGFEEFTQLDSSRTVIRPQGLLRKNPYKNRKGQAREIVIKRHKLSADVCLIVSVAYADVRKGADLVPEIVRRAVEINKSVVYLWVGHRDTELEAAISSSLTEHGLEGHVIFTGYNDDPMEYYAAADVYALPSREDPFPNVVLEAAEVSVPVVAFEGRTGAASYIIENGGRLAKAIDCQNFAEEIVSVIGAPPLPQIIVGSLRQYALDLVSLVSSLPRVSVVVPNYNYADHIVERLASISNQTYPIYEFIVIDDASTDSSVAVIEKYIDEVGQDIELIRCDENSGSVFKQWRKGLSLCKGDVVWIAEADDVSNPQFLESLVPRFSDETLALAFCQSRQINPDGGVLADSYLDYTNDISTKWQTSYTNSGLLEIGGSLSVKNTIPNVSAVIFRREALFEAFEEIGDHLFDYKVAGDWCVYMSVLRQGGIYFEANALNDHRRHDESVTSQLEAGVHIAEVVGMQAKAAEISSVSSATRVVAERYIEHLNRHFGLSAK